MLQFDQIIDKQIKFFLTAAELNKELYHMILASLNADSQTGELYKWAHLTCLSCECAGGKAKHALPGAIAMEFFALAADIFDDLQDQDNDDLPWRKIPDAQAMDMAVCLTMLAFEVLENIQSDRAFRRTCAMLHQTGIKAIDGQYREFMFEDLPKISYEQYFELIRQKAGSLTACACAVGAILSDAENEIIQLLREFGMNFGIMSQIRNDLNDFLNFDKKKDIGCKKKTLPYVYLMNTLEEREARLFQELAKKISSEPDNIELEIREQLKIIAQTQGVSQYCLVMYELYRQRCCNLLESLPVPDQQKVKMKKLVEDI